MKIDAIPSLPAFVTASLYLTQIVDMYSVARSLQDRYQLSDRLGDADWLDGDFSAADLMMAAVLLRLKASGLLNEYPNLAAYVARGEARPAYKRAFDAQLAVLMSTATSDGIATLVHVGRISSRLPGSNNGVMVTADEYRSAAQYPSPSMHRPCRASAAYPGIHS
jgi:hypothetical protein